MNRLSPEDAAFYYRDEQGSTTHLGSLLMIEPGEQRLRYERLLASVESRLALVPRYRRRIREVTLGLGRPVWVDDQDFDITYHVRRSALPEPGTDDQLNDLVARLMSRPLDRHRPLWEMYLVEGLAGNRMALLTKTHRALVDGRAALEINQVILDDDATAETMPEDLWLPARAPSGAELVVGALTEAVTRPWELLDTARAVSAPVTALGSVVTGSIRRIGSMLQLADGAPDSPLNGSTSGSRRFTTASVPAQRCARIAREFDCAVNDVVLAVIAGALRRWLLARDVALDSDATVRAMIPLSAFPDDGRFDELTSDAEWMAEGLRGFVTDLPVGEPNPTVRLSQVAHLTERHAHSTRRVSMGARSWLPEVGPATFHAMSSRAAATMSGRSFNLPVSIARGPGAAQYLAGHRISAIYPVPTLVPNRALAVGLTSYDSAVCFAFNGDRDIMWDLGAMPEFLAESFDELLDRLP
ncbi:wax ester/triacylglycerol synthase family O-acyltransferase [Williamsia sp. CHRR-6]|uniref:wax ester/triacylglycerol synthase family O-acyltransferase n=1 Tax=Williamsia sp. CHRR-6 TaxID=2835871 RepID=UPI0027DB8629|nr:wax ester/triacylglycerol synthase family O-acyltransferase [Williamsia sp. CHRR-6]